MKMGKAGLSMIRLRVGAKAAFDALAHPLQYGSGVAHWLVEHHELHPTIAFIKPQMVGRVWVYGLKRISLYKDCTEIIGGLG